MFSPPDTLDAVHELLQTVWEKSPEVSAENQMRFETALIELVSNVFRHADTGDGVACALTIDISDRHIEAQLSDTGEPGNFKLIEATMPDELSESGRGIALIQAVVDEFTYEQEGEHNIWKILRRFTTAEPENVATIESSPPEVTNTPPQRPEIKFSYSEEFQLAQFGQWPRVIKDLFHLENGLIKLINSDGKWIANEDGGTHIEDSDGGQVSDFALKADGVVCISDTQSDSRILNGTMRNNRAELRSYIGVALKAYDGSRVGVLCGWGKEPRIFSAEEVSVFEEIVKGIEAQALNTLELYRAASIQRGMLPQVEIAISGYEMAGFCKPHLSAGGDFYDWLETSNGVAFTLADVMGKGIGSAILAATVRATIRATAWNQNTEQVMNITSQVLEPDLHKAGSFVTLVHGQLDTFLNRVRYIDAGHSLASHITKAGRVTRFATSNYPIGAGPSKDWELLNIEMAPGDILIMVSDGMLDVYDESQDALKEIANIALAANSAQEIIDELKEIVNNSVVSDDVTALILRRT